MGRRIYLRRSCDNGSGMDTGRQNWLREKKRENFCKREARVLDPNQKLIVPGSKRAIDDNTGSGALVGSSKIIFVFSKGQVIGLSAISGSEAFENNRPVADNLATEQFGNFSTGKRHNSLTWPSAVTIKAAGPNSIPTLAERRAMVNKWRRRWCRDELFATSNRQYSNN